MEVVFALEKKSLVPDFVEEFRDVQVYVSNVLFVI